MELKKFLTRKGISQADFAKSLGVTSARISQIVNKKMNPSIVLAKRIEEITDGAVTTMDLIYPGAPSRYKVKRNDKEISVMGG